MNTLKYITLIAFLSPYFAYAQDNQVSKIDIAKCSTLDGDLERLECFDNLSKDNNLDKPQGKVTPAAGKWDVSDTVNPVDDSRTVVLALSADSGISRWGDKISLIIRCKSDQTDFYISWNDYLGSKANVLTRVGKEQAVSQEWSLSTDKKATFSRSAVNQIKSMLNNETFLAQITPYNESPVTAIFTISGLDQAIKPLRETCSW